MSKEIKTPEDILERYFSKYELRGAATNAIIQAMEEYASQFKHPSPNLNEPKDTKPEGDYDELYDKIEDILIDAQNYRIHPDDAKHKVITLIQQSTQALRGEVEYIKSQYTERCNFINKQHQELKQLRAELERLNKCYDVTNKSWRELVEQIEQLQSELKQAREENERYKSAFDKISKLQLKHWWFDDIRNILQELTTPTGKGEEG